MTRSRRLIFHLPLAYNVADRPKKAPLPFSRSKNKTGEDREDGPGEPGRTHGSRELQGNTVTENESNGDNDEDAKSNVIAEMSRPARMAALPGLLEFASSIERAEGFSEERIGEIGAALREALAIILKSAERGEAGDIVITCKHDHWGKFVIVIADTASP